MRRRRSVRHFSPEPVPRELVDAGLFERRVLDTRPPAVEYRLTVRGKQFEPVLRALARCSRS